MKNTKASSEMAMPGRKSALGYSTGLTKRELIAALVVQGLVVKQSTELFSYEEVAHKAVKISEALLAALESRES